MGLLLQPFLPSALVTPSGTGGGRGGGQRRLHRILLYFKTELS